MKSTKILLISLIVVTGVLVLFPLAMVIFGSFKADGPLWPSPFTLQGYQDAFSNPATYRALWTTLWLGIVRAVIIVILAAGLAWVVARTDTPGTKYLELAIWTTFFLPFQPYIMAWIMFAGGSNSILNSFLMNTFPWIESAPVNLYSYGGIIFTTVLKFSSLVFLLLTPAFRSMDASLEESARMSGASLFTTLRRVTLPLLSPTLLAGFLFAVIACLNSFIIELYLGLRTGIFVYTTRVYSLLKFSPADYPQAMALSVIFLVIMAVLIVMQWKVLRGKQFTTISGRGFATRRTQLGKFKYVTLGFVLTYIVVALIVPLVVMVAGSFSKSLTYFGPDWFTTTNWLVVLGSNRTWTVLGNSLLLGAGAATAGMVLYGLITYIVVRTKLKGKNILDIISWLPWGVPAMMFALGVLWAYVGVLPTRFLYGSMFLMVIAVVTVQLPLGCRVLSGPLHQLGKEMEEVARVSGASWLRTLRSIVAPILAPSFVAVWIIIAINAMKDVHTVVFLSGTRSQVASVAMIELWNSPEGPAMAVVIGIILTAAIFVFAAIGRWVGRKAGGKGISSL